MTGRIDDTARNPIQLPVESLILVDKNEKQEGFNLEEIDQLHAYQTQYKTTQKVHQVDVKRFALMLGDSFIENTKYEGGNPSVTYDYWKTLLNEMKEGQSNISNPLPQKQIDTVLTDLDNCLSADRLFNEHGQALGEAAKADQKSDMKELLVLIDKHLNSESRRFVLPLQYGEKGKSGHVFCAILEKNAQNQILCTILDKGEGSGMHRIVSLSNKQKRSYCFDPIQFRDPDIFKHDSEIGLALLQLLQKYRFPEPNSKANFKSKEIYNLLLQAGTLLDSPMAVDEEIGVTPQRSGTCSEQVVRLLLRDGIHKLNPAHEGTSIYKKVIFAGKFQILLDAYRSKIDPKVLKKGCEEFAVSVLKLKDAGLLSREEWIKSSALIDLVMTETASVLSKEPKVDLLPPLVRKIDPEKRFDFSALQEAPESMPGEQSKKIIDPPILFTAPTPETLLTYLKASAQRMEKSTSPLTAYCQAVQLIRSLPVPRLEDDPFWDKMA